jgi:hypothetical protein
MVSVPVRSEPVFGATVNPTVPLPVPDAAVVIVSHASFAVAVQLHDDAEAVTATDPEPPVSSTRCPVGEIEKVHGGGGADWDTVNVWPPMVSVPVRAAPVFAAMVNVTVPFPVPDAPPVTVSQAALAVAVQVHVLADAVTATEPAPPVSAAV